MVCVIYCLFSNTFSRVGDDIACLSQHQPSIKLSPPRVGRHPLEKLKVENCAWQAKVSEVPWLTDSPSQMRRRRHAHCYPDILLYCYPAMSYPFPALTLTIYENEN